MLGYTLVSRLVFAAVVAALPHSFVLDVGSIDSTVVDEPLLPPPNRTTESFATTSAVLATSSALLIPVPMPTSFSNGTSTTYDSTTSTTCLAITTITITLTGPAPRPTLSSDDQPGQNGRGDPFDTDAATVVSKWPHWFTAATFTLVFYDIIALGLFFWLWVFGHLWWFRRRSPTRRMWVRRGAISEGMEMAPAMDRFGRHDRTADWVRHGLYGRVRSASWERARHEREAELESEMRRLGMI